MGWERVLAAAKRKSCKYPLSASLIFKGEQLRCQESLKRGAAPHPATHQRGWSCNRLFREHREIYASLKKPSVQLDFFLDEFLPTWYYGRYGYSNDNPNNKKSAAKSAGSLNKWRAFFASFEYPYPADFCALGSMIWNGSWKKLLNIRANLIRRSE